MDHSLKDRDSLFHQLLVKKILGSELSESNPLRYELMYHLYHSERFKDILELANQNYFREQFFNFRPPQDIEADIRIFLNSINKMKKVDKLPQAILIGAEIYQRKNSLKNFYQEFFEILIFLEKIKIVLDYCRDGYNLKISVNVALKVSEVLTRMLNSMESKETSNLIGIINQAKILFNLAEPLEFFSSKHTLDEDYERLFNWIAAAINFYDLENILKKTEQIKLFFNDIEYIELRRQIIDFLYILVLERNHLRDKSIELEFLEDQLDLTNEHDLMTWIKLLIKKIKYLQMNSDNQAHILVQKMEKILNKREIEISISVFRRISEVYLQLGEDFDKILHYYKDEFLPQILDFNNYKFFGNDSHNQQFYGILSLMKILIIIGKINSDLILNRSKILNEKDSTSFLFRKAMYQVAHIWVSGYNAIELSGEEFEERISEFFICIERFQEEDRYKISSYNTPWKDLIKALIKTCGRLHPNHLDLLKQRLLEEWNATSSNIYWYSDYIHSALLALTEFYTDNSFIYEELSRLETQMLKGRDWHGRLTQLIRQAKVYMKLEDRENVERILNIFMRETLNIGYRKDSQLDSLISSISLFAEDHPEKFKEKIAWLGALIPNLNDLTEGSAEMWAARELLRVCTPFLPSETFQLFDWFIKNESIQYFSGLDCIISTAIKNHEIDLELIKSIVKYYFVPLSKLVPKQLIKNTLQKVYLEQGETPLKVYSEELVLEVRKYALPSIRYEWFRNIVISLAEFGVSVGELTITTEDMNVAHDVQYIVLEDESRVGLIEVLNSVDSFLKYSELKNKVQDEKSFPWEVVIKYIAPKLTNEEFIALFRSIGNDYILYHMAILFFSNGNLNRAEKVCLQILEKNESIDWPPSGWWNPYYFKSLAILAQLNPSLISERIIPSIIKQIARDSLYIFDKILVLDSIISITIVQNDTSRESIWEAIEDYLIALFDNIDPHNFIFNESSPNDKAMQEEILSLTINNLEHPINVISIKSIEICLSLLNLHNEAVWELIDTHLADASKNQYATLELLYSYCRESEKLPDNIIESLRNLFKYPNTFYRIYIKDIFAKLRIDMYINFFNIITEFNNLLIFKIPEPIQNPQIDHLIEFYFNFELNRLSNHCRFPDSTLRDVIKKLIFQEDKIILFKENYGQMVLNHDRKIGLEFCSFKQEFVAIRKAMYQLTALLIDEGYLDIRWIYTAELIHFFDSSLLCLNSFERPNCIPPPIFDKYYISSQNFLEGIDKIVDNYYKDECDGKVKIAEFTKFRFLNRPNGFEERKFLILKEDIEKNDFRKVYSKIINYEDLINEIDNVDIIIQNEPLWCDMLGFDWIAFNPSIAKKLNWKISKEGLFRWVNKEEKIMVETKKWVEGILDQRGVHFCTVGEGWIVVASQEGIKQIKSLGSIKGIYYLTRGIYSSEKNSTIKRISKEYQI